MLVVGPAEPFGGLFLHGFLHHQLGARLDERLQWAGLAFYPAIKHLINLLGYSLAWWYSLSIHGVWSFLPFRAGELGCPPECTTRRLILQEYIDITLFLGTTKHRFSLSSSQTVYSPVDQAG